MRSIAEGLSRVQGILDQFFLECQEKVMYLGNLFGILKIRNLGQELAMRVLGIVKEIMEREGWSDLRRTRRILRVMKSI